MQAVLDLVYQYRRLIGKCDAGAGLDFEEIGALSAIEATFARGDRTRDTDLWACQREFVRCAVSFRARLVRKAAGDLVRVVDLAPGGFVCEDGPFLQEGDRAELVVADESERAVSYRFAATVAWTRDAADDCVLGFEFTGVPVKLRYRPRTEPIAVQAAA